jgi:hypothetical protein
MIRGAAEPFSVFVLDIEKYLGAHVILRRVAGAVGLRVLITLVQMDF